MRKYKISFDAWGLLLFLLIMAPNIIWYAIAAAPAAVFTVCHLIYSVVNFIIR